MKTVTWRTLRRYPVRFALAVVAVALGVAFVGGTFALRTMMTESFASMSATAADAYVRGTDDPGAGRGLVPAALAEEIASLPGVRDAVAEIQGPVVLVGADGEAVGVRSGGAQRPGDQGAPAPSYAVVVGAHDPAARLVDGAFPADASEVALESETAQEAGLSIGDATRIVLGGEDVPVRVVGLVTVDGAPTGATIVGVDEATGTRAFAASGLVGRIAVHAADGTSSADLRDRADAVVRSSAIVDADAVEVVEAEVIRDEAAAELDSSMSVHTTVLGLFAAVSVLVGAFIIANTFSMTVRQQLPEIAVLRALGAAPRQVVGSVLVQATAVGAIGSVVGTLAGFGFVALARVALGAMDVTLDGAIPVEPATIALCLVLGIVVSLVSALLPARRASRVPPVAAMREQSSAAVPGMRARTIVGGVLLAVGIAATVAAAQGAGGGEALLGVGIVAVPAGALTLAPVAMPVVLRVLAWPAVAIGGTVGRLARGNATRNPRRSAATATALMVGMTLVGAICVFAASSAASLRTGLTDEVGSDFVLQSAQGALPEGLVEAAAHLPSADRVDTLRYATLMADGEPLATGSLTAGAWERSLTLPVVAGDLAALDAETVAVQKAVATAHGWKLGSELELVNPALRAADGQTTTVRVGAIVDSGALGSQVLLSGATYDGMVPEQDRMVGTLFASAGDDAAVSAATGALRAELEEIAEPYLVATVLGTAEYVDSILAAVEQIQAVLYALLGLALVVALLGIVNMLALSVVERTREIGMLRAVGLGRAQVATTVLVESALVTLFGALVGLAAGVGVMTPLATVFEGMGIRILAVPWGQLVAMFAIAAVAGVLAALWPAVRAARLPVLRAVSGS